MISIDWSIDPYKLTLQNIITSEIRMKKKPQKPPSGQMIWPLSVLILDPKWGCVIDGPPGCDVHNNPQTIDGWFQLELRCDHVRDNNNYSRVDLMCRMLRYRFDCLFLGPVAKYPNTYTAYDAYNAAWASLGYTSEQSDTVLGLLDRCPQLPSHP